MIFTTLDGKVWLACLIDKTQVEEGQLLSFATYRVQKALRDAQAGLTPSPYSRTEPVDWQDQLRSARRVHGHPVVRPGRMTTWADADGHKYATTNLVVLWREVELGEIHCECPLSGEPCCTCGSTEGCSAPATVAVRHQMAMALEGR